MITAPCPTLGGIRGPLLVVGCGNGAVIRTALDAGLEVVGVDEDAAVVATHEADGLPVLHRSLADALPAEGTWQTVMLLDGAVQAGDDVEAALERAAALVAPGGLVIVEAVATLRHDGVRAAPESIPMILRAADGFALTRIREDDGHWFVGLRRPA